MGRRRPRQRFRPDLLALEARALLSTLTVTNDNDSGAGSLRAQLSAAHAGDTINFASSAYGTINLTGGPLSVANSVDIKGPGAGKVTVSGDNQSTVFEVQGGVTATISGLTVANGLADLPSGLGGGGIINDGNLTLSGDAITGNVAVPHFGTTDTPVGDGGGVLTEGPLTVTGTTISGNSAFSGGGIASLGGAVTITGSTISGNVVSSYGGGIDSSSGSLTIAGSTITGNSATGDGGGIDIGAFNDAIPGTVTIAGTTISGNSGYSGGGIADFSAPVTIAGSTITGNSAGTYGQGGGIDSQNGPLTITGSAISNNSAFLRGGIDSNGANLSLTACTVSGNTGGGIGIYGTPYMPGGIPTLTVAGSTISGNTAAYAGGGILAFAANVTVSGSVIANNMAQAPAGSTSLGGGINMEGSFYAPTSEVNALTITGSTLTGNQAGGGGAIYTGAYASLSATGSSFVGNTANGPGSAEGGAMDLAGLLQGTISGCLFTGNQAIGSPAGGNAYGGAIEFNSQGGYVPGTLTIQGSSVAGNTAQGGLGGGSGFGGAIDSEADTLTVSGSTIAGNTASGGASSGGSAAGEAVGGGIRSTGGSLTLAQTAVIGNQAIGGVGGGSALGGGVANSGTASFTGALISLNAAEGSSGYGGGLYIATGALTTLKNSQVVGNTASTAGNNIYGS